MPRVPVCSGSVCCVWSHWKFAAMTFKNELSPRCKTGASLIKHKGTFSYDSKFFLIPSGTCVKVFSCASGERVSTFSKHNSEVVAVVRNPENFVQVLSCSDDGVVFKWDPSDGSVLKKYDVSTCGVKGDAVPKVAGFYAPPSYSSWFVLRWKADDGHRTLESVPPGGGEGQVLASKVSLTSISPVAFNSEGGFYAAIHKAKLFIGTPGLPSHPATRFHAMGHKKSVQFTCVACHPTEASLATGDSLGRITIWQGLKETSPVRSIHHWHTLPVRDLAYTISGSFLLSGGGECVLVKWSLPSGDRQFLPRMGLPINHVVTSPDATLLLTAHTDNCLQLVNSQLCVMRKVQGLALGKSSSSPVLLQYDPRTGALLLRGQPGHLQFYQPHEDKQLFCLDVVGQNYMTQEREGGIVNTEVIHIALAGDWLLTVEHWADNSLGPETRLKFWRFDHTLQNFVLDTSVYAPHNGFLNDLQLYEPRSMKNNSSSSNSSPLALTMGNDHKFRLWAPQDDVASSEHQPAYMTSWNCIGSGSFRGFVAGKGTISQDGSLLAVSFGRSATLWSEDCVLRAALAYPHCPTSITALSFGRGASSHLLTSCTETKLVVWDIISLSVLWELECTVTCLVRDVSSNVMAAFCNSSVLLFEPGNKDSVQTCNVPNECQPVRAAAFLPDISASPCGDALQRLCFLSKEQELYSWEMEAKQREPIATNQPVKLDSVVPATPFGALVAQESRSAVTTSAPEQSRLGVAGFREVHQLLDVASHTLPPMTSLYQNLLSAFLTTKELRKGVEVRSCSAAASDDDVSEHHSDSDADMDVDQESDKAAELPAPLEGLSDSVKLVKVKHFAWLTKKKTEH
uniref:WD repeat-containing protein 75 second beta-propeller domain-containing protein n=1 Tax=Amblyomma maculatum TaxID=34609 RepID=G3MND5_AMBMU